VVDATDRERIDDCREELEGLLLQEVSETTRNGHGKGKDRQAQAESELNALQRLKKSV
jgi:hypothetical protein